ncbi:MAG: serine/threonine protein kinase [Acidobacteria bacterium]|nr:serine/threonine protein kinase [Acidobacteriota bacterium]
MEDLFHVAAEREGAERERWLKEACGDDGDLLEQVRQLLASDEDSGGSFVSEQVGAALEVFEESQRAGAREKRAGPYLLVREIGQGGMGTVYLGERADEQYQGEVAVKLLRPGFDTDFFLARFRRERQTLARLQHPNIARLLDSGTTEEGLPYIVMEYIAGRTIREHCDEQGLSIEDRLRLYLPVCAAAAHAHHRFVVHRDIKPSNILVDESGTPKLLDFGICKLLSAEAGPAVTMTAAGSMLTPDYASPEQILGEPVTVASDIYSLGAVLYELLSGQRPHRIEKLTPQAIEKAICGDETVRPSAAAVERELSKRLQGDLDTIVLKAMQKEPSRRYASVEEFAADIRNYLEDRPIQARPDTMVYRAGKFARRNRGPLAAAAALLVVLSGGLFATAREARRNERHFAIARSLANSFVFEVHDSIRNLPAAMKARETIVRLGLRYLDALAEDADGDPKLQVELAAAYKRIGEVQGNVLGSNLGNSAAAMASYRKALALLSPLRPEKDVLLQYVVLSRRVADLEMYTKKPAEALKTLEPGSAAGDRLLKVAGRDKEVRTEVAGLHLAAARAKRMLEDRQGVVESAKVSRQILMGCESKDLQDDEVRAMLAESFSTMGMGQMFLNQQKEALENFELSAKEWDGLVQRKPEDVERQRQRMMAYSHLGDLLGNPNYVTVTNGEAARSAYRTMLVAARGLYEHDSEDQRSVLDYGIASMRASDVEEEPGEKVRLLEESSGLLREVVRRDGKNNIAKLNLAAALSRLGNTLQEKSPAGAREAYGEGVEVIERTGIADPSAERVATDLYSKLAVLEARSGRKAEAEQWLAKGMKIAEKVAAVQSPTLLRYIAVPRMYSAKAEVERLLGRKETAQEWDAKAINAWHEAEQLKGFNSKHREEMQEAERAAGKPLERAAARR